METLWVFTGGACYFLLRQKSLNHDCKDLWITMILNPYYTLRIEQIKNISTSTAYSAYPLRPQDDASLAIRMS